MPHCDADIMAAVRQGRTELFDRLVERYRPRLLRFAVSKLGDVQSAEDAVQETLLAAFTARDSYNPQFAFSTWLWTILLNVCRRTWRMRKRPGLTSGVTGEPVTTETGLTALLDAERQQLLARVLEELPEAEADALRLRFFGGLKFDEIASAMDSSVSGAKRRVKRGLQRMSERLRDRPPAATSTNQIPQSPRPEDGGRHEL